MKVYTSKKKEKPKMIFVEMNVDEALKHVHGMMEQIITKNPNSGRYEGYTEDGEYFSISVHTEPKPKPKNINEPDWPCPVCGVPDSVTQAWRNREKMCLIQTVDESKTKDKNEKLEKNSNLTKVWKDIKKGKIDKYR